MPMIPVEGPESVEETLILEVFGILFHPQRAVGRYKRVFDAELETGTGTFGTRRGRRGDAKQQQNPYCERSVVKHGSIPGSRLVIETVTMVQADRRMTRQQKWQR
jgi:hypothetical protein